MSRPIQEDFSASNQRFGLEAPSAHYAITSMNQFFGEEKSKEMWNNACHSAGVGVNSEDPQSLEKVFRVLAKEPGAVGVLGRSLAIRSASYRKLEEDAKKTKES